jgi:ferredoxin-NADP reductase
MAVVHTATIVASRAIGDGGRHLALTLQPGAGDQLGFVGGQYIIVDSGRTLPNGRAAKRAYSFVSSDADQRRVELVVKLLPGPVSSFLHDAPVGTAFPFSGPWGKLHHLTPPGRAVVLATDTGITAALGLVAGRVLADRAAVTDVVWLADDAFVPEAFVAERLAGRCARLQVVRARAVEASERVAASLGAIAETGALADAGASYYLAGDGDVIYPLKDALAARGVADDRVRLESFFNTPTVDRKVP